MSSSCILWPTLCSAICLCQLPLSPTFLHRSLKSPGIVSCDCRSPGLLCLHMVWSAPPALLVKTCSAFIPLCQCRVTLEVAAGWAAAMENPPPSRHVHAWGPQQHLLSQSVMESSQHNIFIPPDTSVPQLGNHPLPPSCLYRLLLCSPIVSYYKRCHPVISFPQLWMGTKTCIWKISNLTSWLYSSNERQLGTENREAGVWLRNEISLFLPFCKNLVC